MTNTSRDLFPNPSLPPSRLSPPHWPGTSHQSTNLLRTLLKENHENNHVFFDPRGFHNHLAHYLLALWGLGADIDIINAAYAHDIVNQKPSYESPETINADNFNEFLGDERFYTAYRRFFTDAVKSKGAWSVLEEYVFDKSANFGLDGKGPQMLNRLLDGLLHPMIHVGYGVEFGLPGIVVEAGLASAAVHQASATPILPSSLWSTTEFSALDSVTSRLPSALKFGNATSSPKNVHAFTILARILKDARFAGANNYANINIFTQVIEKHGEALHNYVNHWSYDSSNPEEAERKIEELVWTNIVIYGIGGWSKNKDFNADFFHMHLVTSALFLHSLVSKLQAPSQELLLRGYFVISLAWWIGRGRAEFDIEGFFAADTAFPLPVGKFPSPPEKSLPSVTSPKATTPNPWFPILQSAVTIPDDHLPKLHRALVHFGSLYGARAPGQADFVDTELPLSEKLDGSLFIRVAGLTNQRLLRPKLDVEAARFWDRQGFYKS
ncbi:hypothetical protein H0H87_001923 [Tephrocybe sp. NHM501043]|nr:hypothetical protein H0H87_001923 [Tephrocybe sp. NHM501043]